MVPRRLHVMVFLAMAAVGATIYKWVDEKSVTHYSETPPSNQKAREIQTQSSSPAAGAGGSHAAPQTWQDREREFQKRRVEPEEVQARAAAEEAKAQRDAAARKERCMMARQNLHTLEIRKPVYRMNEKGERKYIDDKMRELEIERMKKEIEIHCAP